MASIYNLKPRFQGLLRPLTNLFASMGVSANDVTLFAMALSFLTGGAILYFRSFRVLLLLPLVLFVRMALNAIDGMLAREHNQKTSFGAILNELGDVLSDAALYLPLATILPFDPILIVLIVLFAVISEMTGVLGIQIGASRRYDGPMGKSDRAFVFGTLGLLLGLQLPVFPVVSPVLWIVLALLLLTIFNRSRHIMSSGIHPLASLLAAVGRGISGIQVQWAGCQPDEKQRIYFANHSSHLDFVVLWSALPSEIRAVTRPIAARDYWEETPLRRYLAENVFKAVLVERATTSKAKNPEEHHLASRSLIEDLANALGKTNSLILFPEGTRGTGEKVGPFRSGLFHLAARRPDVELVPAYLENLNRILPKGEFLPVPMLSLLTFGKPIQLEPHEEKHVFLDRARETVSSLRRIGSL
jgi:CDP-diacylglycerol---glycerol-3-phosphate 3-phosphatidyltransferase